MISLKKNWLASEPFQLKRRCQLLDHHHHLRLQLCLMMIQSRNTTLQQNRMWHYLTRCETQKSHQETIVRTQELPQRTAAAQYRAVILTVRGPVLCKLMIHARGHDQKNVSQRSVRNCCHCPALARQFVSVPFRLRVLWTVCPLRLLRLLKRFPKAQA